MKHSGDHIRGMRWVEHVAGMGNRIRAYRVSVGRPKGKRPLDNTGVDESIIIKMVVKKVRWGSMDSIDLTENREG
jgi:hypothetical protein